MNDLRRLYLTRIFDSFDCDVFLEPENFLDNFRPLNQTELTEAEHLYKVKYNRDFIQASNGVKYRFEAYETKK